MAKLKVTGIDELAKQLNNEMRRLERNGESAVLAGAAIAREAMQKSAPIRAEAANSGHKGHLKDHIKIGKVSRAFGGEFSVDVYPDGKRDDGQRYAEVGFVLEYGRSNMPARPWMRPTMELKNEDIINAMREELFKD